MLTASRLFKVLASLTVKPLVLSATTPMLPLVSLFSVFSPPLMFKVSPSFLAVVPVSPAKVSGDCDRSYKSLTVAAEFRLLVSLPAVPKRVTKLWFACPLVASAMADLTLVIS